MPGEMCELLHTSRQFFELRTRANLSTKGRKRVGAVGKLKQLHQIVDPALLIFAGPGLSTQLILANRPDAPLQRLDLVRDDDWRSAATVYGGSLSKMAANFWAVVSPVSLR